MATKAKHARIGADAFAKQKKVSAELFAITYGAIVMQLVKDYETPALVNEQLERMGYNIGMRIVDEFLAKSNLSSCGDFKETASLIANAAFKMFLGVTADVGNWNDAGTQVT